MYRNRTNIFPLLALGVLALSLNTRPAQAQSLATLYEFTGGSDGATPEAGLIQAKDGNLYGTTYNGGANYDGTVYCITPSGTLTPLHSFNGSDGFSPSAGLIQAKDGNLYGTTRFGGASKYGTVYKITPSGTLSTLYSFTGSDGAFPYAGLIQATDGNLYGTTPFGGASKYGTVYCITPSGMLTTLYSFTGSNNGHSPYAGLIQAKDGNLYGTTFGGASEYGTVYKITLSGTLTTLYSFTGGSDGALPYAGLIQASDGNLYGTTYGDSAYGGTNCGTVYKITLSGTLIPLYAFTGSDDGASPYAGLIQAMDGNLYGTTVGGTGGISGSGTVYKITPSGMLTTLHSFTDDSDGASPTAGLIQAKDGNLYGTTYSGGADGDGTVFRYNFGAVPISLVLSPNSVYGGASTNGTVTIGVPAPKAGATINLTSDNAAATVLASCNIAAGKTSGNFTVTTSSVNILTTATITATYNGVALSAKLTIKPNEIKAFTIKPATVQGGSNATGTVTLAINAVADTKVTFTSTGGTTIPAPASITIPKGTNVGTVNIKTNTTAKKVTATITATALNTSKSAKLTATP